jgi:pyruvate dehydrogenase E2 component (dihydrolipoamide acetyltransferase)
MTAPTPITALSTPGVAPEVASLVASPVVRHLAAERHVDLTKVRGTGIGGRVTHADVERSVAAAATVTVSPPHDVPAERPKASPLARSLAAELGIDLADVHATGPGGAIGVEDVRRAASAVRPSKAPKPTAEIGTPQRTEAKRAAIAVLMARSKREITHYYLTETVDLGVAMDWLHERNRTLPVPQRLVPAVALLKAAASAAVAVGELNGFWTDDRFAPSKDVHLGVAVSLRGGGLVAPAIHNADRLELPDLMAALRDLVARTRAGRLRRAEMADPTITVSNLGDQGVESILGVIYPPQVAPEADLDSLRADADLRETLYLDSLDFLSLVELLSGRSGQRIDEDDYPKIATLASTVAFLSGERQ